MSDPADLSDLDDQSDLAPSERFARTLATRLPFDPTEIVAVFVAVGITFDLVRQAFAGIDEGRAFNTTRASVYYGTNSPHFFDLCLLLVAALAAWFGVVNACERIDALEAETGSDDERDDDSEADESTVRTYVTELNRARRGEFQLDAIAAVGFLVVGSAAIHAIAGWVAIAPAGGFASGPSTALRIYLALTVVGSVVLATGVVLIDLRARGRLDASLAEATDADVAEVADSPARPAVRGERHDSRDPSRWQRPEEPGS